MGVGAILGLIFDVFNDNFSAFYCHTRQNRLAGEERGDRGERSANIFIYDIKKLWGYGYPKSNYES